MAPQIVTTGVTQNATSPSTALTMPASIVAKNLLIGFIYRGKASYNVTGWTQIALTADIGNAADLACWVKQAAGGDTAPITGSAAPTGAIVHQISGWTYNLADIAATATAGGFTGAPNPPSQSTPLITEQLWFAVGGGSGTPSMTAPNDYTNLSTALLNSSGSTLAQARRTLTAAAEDPGAFGGSLTGPIGMTIVIPAPRPYPQTQNRARITRATNW
jgi:hypothetical protein